jgi:galactokinase
MTAQDSRQQWLSDVFVQQFGHKPQQVIHAPGRVNLIGDHTDYNGGFVLPAAINFGTDIAISARTDRVVRVLAYDCEQQTISFTLDDIQYDSTAMWSNYVRGTLQALLGVYPELSGADLVVAGNVPQGAGLSSSASFEIALLKAFTQLYQLPLDGVKAALLGQQAENQFVGCNCGIMDQLVSAMGKQGHAMLLDCRDLSIKDAPIPDSLTLFIVNSNIKRGLVDSEYNLRRQQCEQVAQYFGQSLLRDVSLAQLESARAELSPQLYQRAKHVITESERTVAAYHALQHQQIDKLSELMRESHQSLRDDFAVTTPEIDGLVALIDQQLGDQGGVRMTGGGFGGCVVALVPNNRVEVIADIVHQQYYEQFSIKPTIYLCKAMQGAFRD